MEPMVWGTCHEWRLKTYTQDEYVCVTCQQECVGSEAMNKGKECKTRLVPRSWIAGPKKLEEKE